MLDLEKHINELNNIIDEKQELIKKINKFYDYNFVEKFIIAINTRLIYDRKELSNHFKSILTNETMREFAIVKIGVNYIFIEYRERKLVIPIYRNKTLYFEYKCRYEQMDVSDDNVEELTLSLKEFKERIIGCENQIKKYQKELEKVNTKSFLSRLFNSSLIKDVNYKINSYNDTIKNCEWNINKIEKEINEIAYKKDRYDNFIKQEKDFINLLLPEILLFLDKGYTISKKTSNLNNNISPFFLDVNEYINSI